MRDPSNRRCRVLSGLNLKRNRCPECLRRKPFQKGIATEVEKTQTAVFYSRQIESKRGLSDSEIGVKFYTNSLIHTLHVTTRA